MSPPSVVFTTIPLSPTIHPTFSFIKDPSWNLRLVPLEIEYHELPPSLDFFIVPPEPAAIPSLALKNFTKLKE